MHNRGFRPLGFSCNGLVVIGVFLAIGVPAADSPETKSALESEPQDWVDILSSADLKDWFRVPVPPNGRLGRAQWHVDAEKKVLICDGDGEHDMLLFDKE